MPGKVVAYEQCFARNERQNPSSYHSCVGFVQIQRGSNRMQTQFA